MDNILISGYVAKFEHYNINRKFKLVTKDNKGNLKYHGVSKIRKYLYPNEPEKDWHEVNRCAKQKLLEGSYISKDHLGWVIDKEIPSNKDIGFVSLLIGPNVDIVRPQVKEVIEQAELTGAYFQPVWIKEVNDLNKPDYYTLSTTNILDFAFKYDKTIPMCYIPKQFKTKMLDFNTEKYGIVGESAFITPTYISHKAYAIFKDFKPLVFVPVIFE